MISAENMHNFNYWMIQITASLSISAKHCANLGAIKKFLASMRIFKSKQILTPPPPRDQGALAPPSEASPVSYPGALSFPKDLGDGPVQSLQGHQPLGCMVQAGLVTFQIALLWRGRASYSHGYLGALWCLPLSGVGTWQPLGKMVSTSPLCQEAANWGPVYKAAVWQPRPGAQELCHQGTVWKPFSQGRAFWKALLPVYQLLNKLLIRKDFTGFPYGSVVKNLPGQQDREDPLEEDMATHSSVLAWRIPWTRSLAGDSPRGNKALDMTY